MTREQEEAMEAGRKARRSGQNIPDHNPHTDYTLAWWWNHGWHMEDADISDRAKARL